MLIFLTSVTIVSYFKATPLDSIFLFTTSTASPTALNTIPVVLRSALLLTITANWTALTLWALHTDRESRIRRLIEAISNRVSSVQEQSGVGYFNNDNDVNGRSPHFLLIIINLFHEEKWNHKTPLGKSLK